MTRTLACFAIVLALTTATHAQQPSRLDDIIKRGTLRVGMTGDYLPFTSFDRTTSKFRGFDVDMAEALGKALGVNVEYVRTAWPQMTADFEADRFDIAMGGVSITLARQKGACSRRRSCARARRRSSAAPTKTNIRRSPISTNPAPA